MDLELLIIGLIIVVGGFLIFKLIKKLVVATLSFLLLIVVVFAGLGGIIYYDITSLANQKEFSLYVELKEQDTQEASFMMPFENGSAKLNQIKSFDTINNYNDSQTHVIFKKDSFYSLLDKKTISLESFELLEGYKNEISGKEYKTLLDSQAPIDDFVDILYSNYSMPDTIKESSKKQSRDEIETKLKELDMDANDFLFAIGFTSLIQDKKTYIELFNLYKEDEITIKPSTISMQFISYVPTQIVTNMILNGTND